MHQNMKRLFSKNTKDQDFSSFVGGGPKSKKQLLIEECKRRDVSVSLDDPAESSSGVYAELRGGASEAELERRLNAVRAVGLSKLANLLAIIALLVSVVALIKSFL